MRNPAQRNTRVFIKINFPSSLHHASILCSLRIHYLFIINGFQYACKVLYGGGQAQWRSNRRISGHQRRYVSMYTKYYEFSSPSLVETYFSYPEDRSTTHGVLILTDVIGHRFINSQLIADQFAANGYIVAMPDLFHGDSVKLNRPETFNLMSWLEGHPIERVDPVVDSVLKYMRTRLGCEKIGAVGYCFGVRMTNSTGKMCRFQSLTKYTLPPGKIRGPISEARRRQGRRRIYRASRIR